LLLNYAEVLPGKYKPGSCEAELVSIYAKARFNQGWCYESYANRALEADSTSGNEVSRSVLKLFGYSEYEYLQSTRIDPLFPSPYKNLGILYANIYQDKKKAIANLKQYLKYAPGDPQAESIREYVNKLQGLSE